MIYKARLLANGFIQVPGEDYNEICSPITRPSIIRMLFSYAICKDCGLKQMDIKTAYLNFGIDEEIFIQQTEGFEKKNNRRKNSSLLEGYKSEKLI